MINLRALNTIDKLERTFARFEAMASMFDSSISLREFVDLSTGNRFIWYDYAIVLAEALEGVLNGDFDRLMVFMPPRHGKSELVSRLLPAYYLLQNPDKFVGLCAYAAELSYTFSRVARDNYKKMGGHTKSYSNSVKHWETPKNGGLWAAGVGGPILGKGFDLGIIDDPVKNAQEAHSHAIRQRNEDWLDSTFYTRAEPGAAIILIMQRWHSLDMSGYMLRKEVEQPEHWHILNFAAIKPEVYPKYPPTCKIIEDKRDTGSALSPRYPRDKLEAIRARIGHYFWSSLYQQNPTTREGLVYHQFVEETHIMAELPAKIGACTFFHSHDFGAVNEAWGMYARLPSGAYVLYHSEMLPQGTTADRVKRINQYLRSHRVLKGWGGAASEIQQRRDYKAAGLTILQPPIADLESGVNLVNSLFQSNRLFILGDNHEIIDQLNTCTRDSNGDIADKATWHLLDMLRYFAVGVSHKGGTVTKYKSSDPYQANGRNRRNVFTA